MQDQANPDERQPGQHQGPVLSIGAGYCQDQPDGDQPHGTQDERPVQRAGSYPEFVQHGPKSTGGAGRDRCARELSGSYRGLTPAAALGVYAQAMKRLIPWLVSLVVVSLLFGSVYVSLQQIGRMSDEDVPAALVLAQLNAPNPQALSSERPVDLAKGPGTFVNVYRTDGTPVAGSGTLSGSVPRLPQGVIESTVRTGQDRVTWQPQVGIRYAIVARAARDTVVVAGQNLQPSETRDTRVLLFLGLGWLGSVLVIAAGYALTVGRSDWMRGKWRGTGRS